MKKREQSVFFQTLELNFIIVCVIVICLVLMSFGIRSVLQAKEEENCRRMLEEGMDHMTVSLQAVRDDIMMLRDSVQQSKPYGLRKYDAVNLLRAKSQLVSIINSNRLIRDIALVYEDRDMVITGNSIYYSIDDFLNIYSFEGMDTSAFYHYLDEDHSLANMRFFSCSAMDHWDWKNAAGTAFGYAIPLDTERFTTSRGVAYVFVDLDRLLDIFISDMVRPYASFYLYNHRETTEEAEPLLFFSGDKDDSAHFDATLVNSTATLRAEIRISNEYLDAQMKTTNLYLVWTLVMTVLAGVGTALWASHRQYQPMKQAIRRLQDRGLLSSRRKNEYTALMHSVESLLEEKESISRELSGYQVSLHQNLLDRLFSNNLLSFDMEESLRMELVDFPKQALIYCGRIFIPSADTNQTMEMTLMMVLEYLKRKLPPSAVLHSTDTLTFGLIYPCEGTVEEAETPLKEVLSEISQAFAARIVLISGGRCESMNQIGSCFERAQAVSLEGIRPLAADRLIIHPGDMSDREQGLRLRMLQEMHQFMISGDADQAIDAMKRFYGCPADSLLINLNERYSMLRAYIMMAAREIAPDAAGPEMTAQRCGRTLDEQTAALADGIRQVCGHVAERQASLQGDQCAAYTEYLKEHFMDPEMCATSLADEFRVSEKYLFGLFKKNTGYSPTSYLHHIRMEEAVRLLLSSDDTVQEISVRVGFANFGTFYKAFKREYGTAPGRYREMHQAQGGAD